MIVLALQQHIVPCKKTTFCQTKGHILRNNATIFLFTGLNTAAPTQTMPLHPQGEYSQPTANYIEITAAAGAGIKVLASNFEIP